MGYLSPTHWLVVALVVAVLFGAKRLPEAARGVGRSLRIFRAEIRDVADDAHDRVVTGTEPSSEGSTSSPCPSRRPGS